MSDMCLNKTVKTTCPYCGVGCGLIANVDAAGSVSVKGDEDHPANFGRLCSKGTNLAETVDLHGRLLFPEIYDRQAGWDEALDLIANKFRKAIREFGPDSVAFYGSGQLLTEDYYVANKLMKGFIGSANMDTNSRLCMSSTVAGQKRAFGSDTVPGTYEDLEQCDLLVLVGSNLAWCHPVLLQRIKAAKEQRPHMKVVLIDPRRTATMDIVDMHLPIKSDGDAALFNGLLCFLADGGFLDRDFVDNSTTGFDEAFVSALSQDLDDLLFQTGLEKAEISAFFELFSVTQKTVTVFSQGVNQSVGGTDKVNTILNCHLATGRIGKPGMGPFSVTGQPNAMGGREVGGLSNQLAAHMELENPEHRNLVQEFWKSPVIADKPGLKAVDLFKAISAGKIKALWILATNPADSLPDANAVQEALQKCDFVVVSDIQKDTDTARFAHVKLPSLGWGEKKGVVTNSERRISLQTPFLEAPGQARADWWQLAEVGKRMGFEQAFNYSSSAEIFKEHAALSGYKNNGQRDFDISGLADLTVDEYDTFQPTQWPATGTSSKSRFFADRHFYTDTGKANFIPVQTFVKKEKNQQYPLLLNTGRVRDHWHTMTQTARSAKLSQHKTEPFVEIHPLDARLLKLDDNGLARIENNQGYMVARVAVTDSVKPSSVFIPIHWTDQFASSGRVDVLVGSDVDPISGQPGFKHNYVSVSKYPVAYHGYSVGQFDPDAEDISYWAKARCQNGWQTELAFQEEAPDWRQTALNLWGNPDENAIEILYYEDKHLGTVRLAAFRGAELVGAFFVSKAPLDISRNWVAEQLQGKFEQTRDKMMLLAGRPGRDVPEKGAIVCACFNVGDLQISRAIKGGCHSVEDIGVELSAGTNCGSCRSEIQSLMDRQLNGLVGTG